MDILLSIINHPYIQVLAGIILWELQALLSTSKMTWRQFFRETGRSMIAGSMVVIFDDETVYLLEDKFDILVTVDWEVYLGAGFAIDFIRRRFYKTLSNLADE